MGGAWVRVLVAALALPAALPAQQRPPFSPPRIVFADLPAPPPPMAVGGGEVLVEAIIDRSGTVTRPVLLRSTPPYAQMVLDAIARWRFQPARATGPDGVDASVEAPILIAAVYRPPTLLNGPTIGEPPKDVAVASRDVAYPAGLVTPAYPPNALTATAETLLFEILLDETGGITEVRPIASNPAFESAARDALMQMRFRPGLARGRSAPSTAYVLFGFRPPVVISTPPKR
jgi:TonB family protein